ncbi:P27 family phage terminase small subunit [Bradyrhizobium guangdongense]
MRGDPVQIKFFRKDEMTTQPYKPPKHLSKEAAAFFNGAVAEYEFEPHHIILLTKACEAFDRAEDARKVIAKEGMTYQDRFGSPRAHPAVAIERDSRIGMARLFRELGLDIGEAASGRPPALPANRR